MKEIVSKHISKGLIIKSLMLLMMAAIFAMPASAGLQAVGAIDNANGFPFWYQDSAGMKLAPCLDGPDGLADPKCVVLADARYDPTAQLSFPNNFPGEFFYYVADSDKMIVGPNLNSKAILRMALEGTFSLGVPDPGQQTTFLRINLKKMSGLTPGKTYTVTYPFGTFQFKTDNNGNTLTTVAGQAYRTEDGCVAAPCDFNLLLSAPTTKISTFLHAVSPAPLTGYIGDPLILQTITAGPLGNFFRIDGPDIGGKGINTIQTELWNVAGKVFVPNPILTRIIVSPPGVTVPLGTTQQFTATALDQYSEPMNVAITWGTNDTAIGIIDATGLFTPVSEGIVNVTATNGSISTNVTVTVSGAGSIPILTSIEVNPALPTINAGKTRQFNARALDQFGSPIAATITWTSDDPFIGTINPSAGYFASMGVGQANIKAENGTINGSTLVTVISSGLQGVGPADPANGFPLWYLDSSGTRLGQCIAGANGLADPNCVVLADPGYNPSLSLSYPNNFPSEFFYYIADSDSKLKIGPGLSGKVVFRMALEGTFGFGNPQIGQDITFLRINLKKTSGLVPNSVYNVTYPFGKFSFRTDGSGTTVIDTAGQAFRTEDGGFDPVSPDVFSALLPATNTKISMFLKAISPAPPAGYIGNPGTLQTITPGPNGNFLRIEGPSAGGKDKNFVETNLWSVAGKVYTGSLMPTVYSIDPANKAINVPIEKTIIVTYSNNIGEGTSYDGISVKDDTHKNVAINKKIVGNLLYIDPVADLQYGRTYTVFLPENAVEYDTGGYQPASFSSKFTTKKK